MIRSESNTPLRFYDSIDKQNRFKSFCENICEFKLLSPLSSLLPFQFDTGLSDISVLVWRIMCAADDTDMGAGPIEMLDVLPVDTDYIIFNGLPEESESSYITSCGSYYFQIETNQGIFYSEVFQAEDFPDITFVQSELPIFSPWRFYDNQQKQNRFKSQCAAVCDFTLITEWNLLLPFIFRIPESAEEVERWVIRNEICEQELRIELIQKYNSSDTGYDYFYYKAINSPMSVTPITLPNGDFSTNESWESIDSSSANFEWDINIGNRGRFIGTGRDSGSAIFSNQIISDGFLEVEAGQTYEINYTVFSLSGPTGTYVAIIVGGAEGERRYTSASYTDTITALEDGYLQLFGFKADGSDSTILVDNITVNLVENLPCGSFESIVSIGGVDYYSEWITILPAPEVVIELGYLLQEDGFLILQEDGFGILLE